MEPQPQGREPLFNAPWPALAVVASILGSYAYEAFWGGEPLIDALAFAPSDLDQGHWLKVLSVMVVHGSWMHAIMNALGALAFGPPVARAMGTGARGALVFFLFYVVCGGLSSLAYAALHLHSPEQVVGASGAVSGLMGAAARMLGPREAGLSPIFSPTVLSVGLGWILVNGILAVSGVSPLMAGARIAWEAHIGGFIAGALIVGLFIRLAAPAVPASDVPPPDDRVDVT